MITYAVQGNASPNPTATKLVSAGDGPTLIRNNDTQFSCDISYSNMINQSTLSNAITLNAGGTIVVDGTRDVFAIGNFGAGSIQVQVVEGGISFFQRLSSLLLTDPSGSDFILLQTGHPPMIEIGTGDVAEATPAEILSGTAGSGPTRQFGVQMTANRVTGEPSQSQAFIDLFSPSVNLVNDPFVQLGADTPANQAFITISPSTVQLSGPQLNGARVVNNVAALLGVLDISNTDAVSNTVTAGTFTRLTKAWSIPGNDANAATCYLIAAWFSGTQGSTAQTLSFRLAAFGITGAGSGFPSTFAGVSVTFSGIIIGIVQVTSTGAGTAVVQLNWICGIKAAGASSSSILTGNSSVTTATTTIAENLEFDAQWGATVGAPTITCQGSLLARMGN